MLDYWSLRLHAAARLYNRGRAKAQQPTHPLFNIPHLILGMPNIGHRQILRPILALRYGETITQERKDISRVVILHVVVFKAWSLHVLQVVEETAGPDVDATVWFVILGYTVSADLR